MGQLNIFSKKTVGPLSLLSRVNALYREYGIPQLKKQSLCHPLVEGYIVTSEAGS